MKDPDGYEGNAISSAPSIASERSDICVDSVKVKKVCFIELTSPMDENIALWIFKKREIYIDLVEEAKSNGFLACFRTIEVGARGFVSKRSMSVFTMFGFGFRQRNSIRKELSKIAISCSHFM